MQRLSGPRAKVKRASSQIVALDNAMQEFFKKNRYGVILSEFNRKKGYQYVRIKDAPILPDEWGVIVGEIVHNLRSALDLLVWQLRSNESDSDTDTQFPICNRYKIVIPKKGISSFWVKRKEKGSRKKKWVVNSYVKNVDRKFLKRLQSFQPYKRVNRGKHNPLILLQHLNNTDKHRIIPVLNTMVAATNFQGLIGGGSRFKVGVTLTPNAVVGHVNPLPYDVSYLDFSGERPNVKTTRQVQVNLDITPGICFGNSCDPLTGLPVIKTLTNISNEVSGIIESFAGDFG
jgi:hypothetical protein